MTTDEDVSAFVVDPDVLNMKWFYVVRLYDSQEEAKVGYDSIIEWAKEQDEGSYLAGYRLLDDLPTKGGVPKIVVAVGTLGDKVRSAARIMGGVPFVLNSGVIKGLILRRLRFLLAGAAFGLEEGIHQFQHGPGMRLNESGEVVPLENDADDA